MDEKLSQLRADMEAKSGSVKAFCEQYGFSEVVMSRFLNGRTNILSNTLFAIFEALDISTTNKK